MISTQYVSLIALQRDKVESFERDPFSLPAIRSLQHIDLHPRMTFFVGENGSGKSTLLEAIAVSLGFNAEGGTRNFRFGTWASHSPLRTCLRVESFFRIRGAVALSAKDFDDALHRLLAYKFVDYDDAQNSVTLKS